MEKSKICDQIKTVVTVPCGNVQIKSKEESSQTKCWECGKIIETGIHCSYECQLRDKGMEGVL